MAIDGPVRSQPPASGPHRGQRRATVERVSELAHQPEAAGTSPEVGCRRQRDVQTYFDCRPTADWERAIFTGYRVCHRLRDHGGGGGGVLDADGPTLTLETDGERHGLAVEDDDVMS